MDALLCKDALAFLGKVMRVAIDLINLSPVIGLDNDILNRVWIGKDVCYDHVIVFSCRAHVHFLKDEISKLDDEATPCIFIGYGHVEFAYRLLDLVNKKIVKIRDVVFLEDKVIDIGN